MNKTQKYIYDCVRMASTLQEKYSPLHQSIFTFCVLVHIHIVLNPCFDDENFQNWHKELHFC